jgi:hypothetical protein
MSLSLFTLIAVMQLCPKDFAVTYTYVSGSVPPPYHYEYSVKIDAKGNGTITYTPDYVLDTSWTEIFILKKKTIRKYYSFLKKNCFFEKEFTKSKKHPVGGSVENLEITVNGKSYFVPAFPVENEMAEKIIFETKNLIPQNLLDSLSSKRENLIETYKLIDKTNK